MWQPSCQNCRGVRREKNRRKKKKELWQPSCWKLREKFNSNLGNEVAKNEGKKIRFRPKFEGKKIVAIDLWQWNCRNGRKKIYIYLEESITSPLPPDSYSPSTSKYILWSFPIKSKLPIWIYVINSFLSFHFSPRYKRQAPSLKHCISYIFHIASLTSDCSVLYYSSTLLQCAQLGIVIFGLIWVFLLCLLTYSSRN